MKLELKHLAGYLPYGLRIQNGKEYDIVAGYDNGRIISMFRGNLENFTSIEYVKPILRPLSDLTKEIEVNGEKFVPIDWLRKNISEKLQFSEMGFYDYEVKGLGNKLHYSLFDVYQYEIELSEIIELTQKLYEWHLDIHCLIPDLAIDINTIKL